LPILQKKIKNNEDFLLTDEEMTRFIITEENAIELIFDAFKY
jgi:FlaA1/EpsC-like NDP-sugar epimerase